MRDFGRYRANMATLWCVGRNYKDHAQEMQAELPKSPLIFMKAEGCLSPGNKLMIPSFTEDLHHELELAVKLDQNLKPQEVALALDLTARDRQSEAKKGGLPWALAKSFINSCPISQWITYEGDAWFQQLNFSLAINAELKQQGQSQQMIFSLPEIIEHLKKFFPIQGGDIILTGTPSGVGPIKEGDEIKCELVDQFSWTLKAGRTSDIRKTKASIIPTTKPSK